MSKIGNWIISQEQAKESAENWMNTKPTVLDCYEEYEAWRQNQERKRGSLEELINDTP